MTSTSSTQLETVDETIPWLFAILAEPLQEKANCTTHILVFMLANKQHNCKPYAITIQYVPDKGIGDQAVRDLTNKIKIKITKAHLKVVGMYSFVT